MPGYIRGICPSLDDSVRIVGPMPGVDAWCALADQVVAANDPAIEDRARTVLVSLGVTDDERAELAATIRGREDPAGLLLAQVVELSLIHI